MILEKSIDIAAGNGSASDEDSEKAGKFCGE
jgi:hypothetical protein